MEFELAEMVVAAGALGTAAFGIVDGIKGRTAVGLAGFEALSEMLGALGGALDQAYGPGSTKLLRAQYRNGRAAGQLPRTLSQGARVGLTRDNAPGIAKLVGDGVIDASTLAGIAGKIAAGQQLEDTERNRLARFELAVDTRIDAALALAERVYKTAMRGWASAISVVLALVAAAAMGWQMADPAWGALMVKALVVGIVAVPLAPIAKDVAAALQSATRAIKGGRV